MARAQAGLNDAPDWDQSRSPVCPATHTHPLTSALASRGSPGRQGRQSSACARRSTAAHRQSRSLVCTATRLPSASIAASERSGTHRQSSSIVCTATRTHRLTQRARQRGSLGLRERHRLREAERSGTPSESLACVHGDTHTHRLTQRARPPWFARSIEAAALSLREAVSAARRRARAG